MRPPNPSFHIRWESFSVASWAGQEVDPGVIDVVDPTRYPWRRRMR
jgi:hypothetical protein